MLGKYPEPPEHLFIRALRTLSPQKAQKLYKSKPYLKNAKAYFFVSFLRIL